MLFADFPANSVKFCTIWLKKNYTPFQAQREYEVGLLRFGADIVSCYDLPFVVQHGCLYRHNVARVSKEDIMLPLAPKAGDNLAFVL